MKTSSCWTDEQIIAALSEGGNSRERVTSHLIDTYVHLVPVMVKKTGLVKEAALDVFTDAILDLMEQAKQGIFRGESKLSTYLYKIFYFKCVDLSRKNTTKPLSYPSDLPELADQASDIQKKIETGEDFTGLLNLLDQLGEPCRQILLDWGFWGYSMADIAERTGLGGSVQVKDRKYKCLQRLRKLRKSS